MKHKRKKNTASTLTTIRQCSEVTVWATINMSKKGSGGFPAGIIVFCWLVIDEGFMLKWQQICQPIIANQFTPKKSTRSDPFTVFANFFWLCFEKIQKLLGVFFWGGAPNWTSVHCFLLPTDWFSWVARHLHSNSNQNGGVTNHNIPFHK